jgi:hypothetical protein
MAGAGADLFVLWGSKTGVRKRIADFDPTEDSLRFDYGGTISGVTIEEVDRGPGRLGDARVRIELLGGVVAQDVLLVGLDDAIGVTVEIV